MKCSEVILKVTYIPMKLFYEMPLWGESLIARLIKLYERHKKEMPGVTSSRKPRSFLFKM